MVSRSGILAGRRAWREGDNGGRRLGVARGRERWCLNRVLDRDVAMTAKMPPYHDAPRPARVRAAPRTDRRVRRVHGARTTQRRGGAWRVERAEVSRARRQPREGAWTRAAHGLGQRGVGRRAGAA
jgi:hypothetical protein